MSTGYTRAPYGRERGDDARHDREGIPADAARDGGRSRERDRNSVNDEAGDGRERRRKRRDATPLPTYYGLPAVKSSHYGWLIATYFFAGGLAGGAQVIATLAEWVGRPQDRKVVRAGRYIALAGTLVSPLLLIADLHTPQRFYNMLRIVRRTSPMSIGAWVLLAFGNASGLAALGHVLHDVLGYSVGRPLARIAGIPAAITGAVMCYYTGILLSATSTPLWASAHRLLPALFGATAVATGNAAITLVLSLTGASRRTNRRLETLAVVAGTAQLALVWLMDHHWKQAGLDEPLQQPRLKWAHRLGTMGVGILLPRALFGAQLFFKRESRLATAIGALGVLVGGFVERVVILQAGNLSAKRPEDYFRLTQSSDTSALSHAVQER